MLDWVLSVSALIVDPVHDASVASPSVSLVGTNADVEVSATVASVFELEIGGCTPMEDSGALGAEMVDLDSGKVGSTPASTAMVSSALKNGSQSLRWHQWVKHNRFSALSEMGNEMGTEFREEEDPVEASSDYHEVVV